MGKAASTAFLAKLEAVLDTLAQKYVGRVEFEKVSGDAASPTNLQVLWLWGTNARNWTSGRWQDDLEQRHGEPSSRMGYRVPAGRASLAL